MSDWCFWLRHGPCQQGKRGPGRMEDGLLDDFEAMASEWDRVDHESIGLLRDVLTHLRDGKEVDGKFVSSSCSLVLNKWKGLHSTVSKFAKTLEKKLKQEQVSGDILVSDNDPARTARIDELVQECLLHHFYRKGDFDSADTLIREAGLSVDGALKEPYVRLSGLMESLRDGDIQPSMDWAKENRAKLKEEGQRLEFELCRLRYLTLLQQQRPNEALRFAQKQFPQFSGGFGSEVQTLMGCLAYANRLSHNSPYKSYVSTDFLLAACSRLSSAYCKVQQLPQESAFTQCIKLGTTSLPKINRVLALMKEKKGVEWSQQDELPVEIELSNDLRFHSVFVCPVLRQQGTDTNPPMMLPCGHVICQEALGRLSKGSAHVRFKCPYCPVESSASQAMRVYF